MTVQQIYWNLNFFFVENAFILEKIEFFMFDKEFGDKI